MLLRKRKKTSSVWNDFDEVEIVGAGKKEICKYWKVRLSIGGPRDNTSHLRRHSEKCNERRLHVAKEKNQFVIPKTNNPQPMKDFRPISLCNILYKIISKTLANRLKPFLKKCIFKEQYAFVEGHSILNNVLISYEVIHLMRSKTKGKLVKWL